MLKFLHMGESHWGSGEYRLFDWHLGRVIVYSVAEPTGTTRKYYKVIQLAIGVAPERAMLDGMKAQFEPEVFMSSKFNVTHALYRPIRRHFDALGAIARAHVLQGGLLLAPLTDACRLNMTPADDWPNCTAEWVGFAEHTYGIKPSSWPVASVETVSTPPPSHDLGGEG